MLHDSHAVLSCLTIILVKGHMDGLFAYTVNSLLLLISQILESHPFYKPYIGLAQENIDLNMLSVTITDMTCAPADCHSHFIRRICEGVALRVVER